MHARAQSSSKQGSEHRLRVRARRAWREFLKLPTYVVLGVLVLAVISMILDSTRPGWLGPVRDGLSQYVGKQAPSVVLQAVAQGIVTVTSITFSVLLIAVQQQAASMTPVVFDQFLRRKTNQLYLGMFVGLALYSYLVLATVDQKKPAIFGAAVALLLTVIALALLVLLVYSTVDQMRPSSVVQVIHDHAMNARARERSLFDRTRRHSEHGGPVKLTVTAQSQGFVTWFDLDRVARVLDPAPDAEVEMLVSVGDYVAYGDALAKVRDDDEKHVETIADELRGALRLERDRLIDADMTQGVEDIENIGWTAGSTAKQNPAAAVLAIRGLRDMLAHLAQELREREDRDVGEPLRIVYPDRDAERLLESLVSLALVSGESHQHRTYAEALRALGGEYAGLPERLRPRADEAIIRALDLQDKQFLRTAPISRALEVLLDGVAAAKLGGTSTGATESGDSGSGGSNGSGSSTADVRDPAERVRALVSPPGHAVTG